MKNNAADITGAIAALSGTLKSMKQQQIAMGDQLSREKQGRRERLDQRVATLLPAISGSTMARLTQAVPSFAADRQVMDAFERHRKFMWLFKSDGYDDTFALLQTRLKLCLESQGYVSESDNLIQRLESEKAALASRQSEVREMRLLMEKAQLTDTPLPPNVISSINNLAQLGRNPGGLKLSSPTNGAIHSASYQANTLPLSSTSDMDLYLWMKADIPTSFRTLMLELTLNHDDSAHSALQCDGEAAGSADAFDHCVSDSQNALTAETAAVATDDRLGAFS